MALRPVTSAWRNFVASTYEMIETLDSDSATSSGRSRSKRSVGRLSRSLTKASNSVNVFASMAFITTEEVGTFALLSEDISRVPSYLNQMGSEGTVIAR